MEQRDERLIALETDVKSAESKLKSSETSLADIEKKLKSNEDSFMEQLAKRSEKYKSQTGAELQRNEDKATGKVTYDFVREATDKEQRKRQKIVFKRVYDETGKYKLKPQIVVDDNDKTVTVMTAKDLKKPKERKKFFVVNMPFLSIRRIDTNSPFIQSLGKPITVPARAAARLAKKIYASGAGQAAVRTAKAISSPVIIPAKIIKDITDKGGVIHAVVDLGDRIKIEGVNVPKPLKAVNNAVKGAALGAETGAVEAAKSMGSFSIEIAKNKILEEINNGVSENEATEAAYVIGMKMLDIYRILDEHSKYKKAVNRDIAGDDIVDTGVSEYLAEKEEKKFQKSQDKLKEQKSAANFDVQSARDEYEAAKKRLDNYKKSVSGKSEIGEKEPTAASGVYVAPKGSSSATAPKFGKADLPEITEKGDIVALTKTDKKIEKVKKKLTLNQKHRYKASLRRVAVTGKDGKSKFVLKPVVRREEVTGKTPATAWNTAKKLDGYFVNTGIQSMRKKALRDGNDNTAVEAADFAVTAVQTGNKIIKTLDSKERVFKEKSLKKQLTKLENEKSLETAASKLREKSVSKAAPKEQTNKKTAKKQQSTNQNKLRQQKRQQKTVRSNFVEKSKEAAKDKVKELAGALVKKSGGMVVILILGLLVPVMFPVFCLSGSGVSGGLENFVGNAVSPCETKDLSLSEQYYTELAKNLIEQHRNIKDYYTGYDKYTCLTEISKIDHSPQKLLPFLAVSAMSTNGSDSWDFESAKPFIESAFDNLYSLYTNEVRETRLHVTQKSQTEYYGIQPLGGSTFNLGINGMSYNSANYTQYAEMYDEYIVASDRNSVTYYNVGKYTDGNGYTHEYEDAQDITLNNYWDLKLLYYWNGEEYEEEWRYYTECQESYEYDYVTLEYAIRENDISVYDDYWTETDDDWQDNNFDKLIYNQYHDMSDEEKEQFDNYYAFFMGHQVFDMPFENAEITQYAGYNTDINGDMLLRNSMKLKCYSGQEIICGMSGKVIPIDNGFALYNQKYGTLYYYGAVLPSAENVKQGDVISSATGDTLEIYYLDNESNYVNPLFVFS